MLAIMSIAMLHHSPFTRLVKKRRFLLAVALIGAVIGFGATFLFPLEYRADAEILIISRARFGTDPLTAERSAERIGENLSQVMQSNDFYAKVLSQSGFVLDTSRFDGKTERTVRRLWQKMVKSQVVFGTGVLSIDVYHPDRTQAERYAEAVLATLQERASEYVAADIGLKIINDPVSTPYPVRPNIILNMILGAVAGLFVSTTLVLGKK